MFVENSSYKPAPKAQGTFTINRFTMRSLHHGEVVIDRSTGLMWQQIVSSQRMAYSMAMDWIKDLNRRGFAGFSDWRLPNLEEAMTLLERFPNSDGLYIDPVFPSQKRLWIWTSEKKDANLVWYVNFNYGYSQLNRIRSASNCVRAVR